MVWCDLHLQRKWLFVLIFFVLILYISFVFVKKEGMNLKWRFVWEGYNHNNWLFYLPSDEPSSSPRSILFLEGFSNDTLSPRMLCTIESAAKMHATNNVFVMMTSQYLQVTSVIEGVMSNYKNVKFVHVNTTEILMNSMVKEWFLQQRWKTSHWPEYHFNDVLRWALLWKYGGIFIDMDVVVLKNLLQEKKNFSCLESERSVGMAALGFSKEHPIIEECLRWLNIHFDGTVWGANGPRLLTKVLIDQCEMELPSGNIKKCDDIKIYPPKAFHPLPWQEWFRYADSNEELANSLIHDPDVFALHTWGSRLQKRPIILSESSPYAVAARTFCPIVVSKVGDII